MTQIPLGPLLSDTLRIVWTGILRLLAFTLIYAIFLGGATILLGIMLGLTFESAENFADPETSWMINLLALVLTVLSVPYGCGMIYDAHERLHSRPSGLGAMFGQGFARTPRALVVLLIAFLIYIGLVFVVSFVLILPMAAAESQSLLVFLPLLLLPALVVGGMAIYCIWFLVPAVCVIEGRMGSSFGRSAALTKGSRFVLLAAMLVMGLVGTGLYVGVILVALLVGTILESVDSETLFYVAGAFGLIAYFVILMIMSSLQLLLPTVAFVKLRELKEGGESEGVVEVFQ